MRRYYFQLLILTIFVATASAIWHRALRVSAANHSESTPTFYRDVLPILQQHCQSCHRPGEIAPLPLMTYEQARAEAHSIAFITASRKMPPWFADPNIGHFANDPSLTAQEIALLDAWWKAKAPAGDPNDAPAPRVCTNGWNIPQPDAIVKMTKPVALPAQGDIEYTYEIVPTHFTEAKWVQLSEIRPSGRESVHHAVVYVRPYGSKWLEHAPVGIPFTAADMVDEKSRRDALWTDADILLVYAPGSSPDRLPDGMAKLVPAGSDLLFQMHYMARGHPAKDRDRIDPREAATKPTRPYAATDERSLCDTSGRE
jgi:hypothetical protein